ncbi:MAG: hypothetical protein WKF77_03540 [Planctomycetaceae bacterium]
MYGLFLNLFVAIAVTSFMAASAYAQNEKTANVSEDSAELQVKAMIEKLESPDFSERQQAAKYLLNVGAESVALMERMATNAKGEMQRRLSLILPRVRTRLFDDQLEAFLKKPSIEIAQRLPQWDRFEKISGHDDEALQIFGEILAAEPRLFATRLFAPSELPALLVDRAPELAKKCSECREEEFPVASVAAVMLLGSESQTRLIRDTSTNISILLDAPYFSELITDGVHAKTLRAIAEAWIVRAGITTGIAAERPLLFSMKHDLQSGRTVELLIVKSKSNRPDMILSLLCLAKLKSTEDLPLIESLLDNDTILWPQRGQVVKEQVLGEPPVDTNYKVQTRDVALVVAAYLRDLQPEQIGSIARTSNVTLFAHDSLGFHKDEARSEALAAYRRLTDK